MNKMVFILCGVLSFKAFADCDTQNCIWQCGEHCTAIFDKNSNVLNVKGYGAIYNYDNYDHIKSGRGLAPWRDYAGDITKVVFENESDSLKLTSVGDYAFAHMATKEIVLSEGIQSTGYGSFYANTSLEKMNIPTTLETIGSWTYSGSQISEINIPETVKNINWAAFQASNAETIVIPDSINVLPEHSFLNCEKLKNIVIGSGVQEILQYPAGAYGFENTPLLENVYCQASNRQVCADALSNSGKTQEEVETMLKTYVKDQETGIYQTSDGKYFASSELMGAGKFCATKNQCAEIVEALKYNQVFNMNGKFYASLSDWAKDNYIKKRIYTIDEANAVAGEKNRVSIKYR